MKTTITMQVKGFLDKEVTKTNEEGVEITENYTQLQTTFFNDKDKYEKATLKLNKLLTEDEKKELFNKVVTTNTESGLSVYGDVKSPIYATNKYEIVKGSKVEFEANTSLVGRVMNMIDKPMSENAKATENVVVLQVETKEGWNIRTIDIKIKGASLKDIKIEEDKEVLISNIKVFKWEIDGNKGTSYSTSILPTVAK